MKLKKGETTVKCHCGKVSVKIKAPTNVTAQVVIWCSEPCSFDWATGGM